MSIRCIGVTKRSIPCTRKIQLSSKTKYCFDHKKQEKQEKQVIDQKIIENKVNMLLSRTDILHLIKRWEILDTDSRRDLLCTLKTYSNSQRRELRIHYELQEYIPYLMEDWLSSFFELIKEEDEYRINLTKFLQRNNIIIIISDLDRLILSYV